MRPEFKLLIFTFFICSGLVSWKIISDDLSDSSSTNFEQLDDQMTVFNDFLSEDYQFIPFILNKVKSVMESHQIEKIEGMIDKGITVLSGKTQFFCWGPAIKKCEEENPGAVCEKSGVSVRPKCKEGFDRKLGQCVSGCPDGFRDDGLYCYKPKAYGRGAGYAIWNEKKCNNENPDLGCEKNGLLYYPKCKEGFHAFGCCVCSPNCPEGYTDIGISCQKPVQEGTNGIFDKAYPVHIGLKCLDQENQIEDGDQLECEQKQGLTGHLKGLLIHHLDKFADEYKNDLGDKFQDIYQMVKDKIIKYEEC